MPAWAKRRAVLVLDGTTRTIVTIGRSLHRHGIPAISAQLGRRGLSRHSNAVRADVALPAGAAAFGDALKALLVRYDIDTVMPNTDKAVMALLPHYDEITRVARITCPEPSVVARVLDKRETLAAAKACGVPIPVTYSAANSRALDDIEGALRFPMIAKPAIVGETLPWRVAHFNDARELEDFLADWSHLGPFLLQEYVPGDGVGVSVIVEDGRPLTVFAHRRLHEYPPSGGYGTFYESETPNPELVRAATSLLERLRWRGAAMVEFRHHVHTGRYALMEVNGRSWGSLPLAVSAGVDFPYLQWQLAHGLPVDVPKNYRSGLRMRNTAAEIQRFADLATSASERRLCGYRWVDPYIQIANSFRPGVRSALFSISDPLPESVDVAFMIAKVALSKTWRLARNAFPEPLRERVLQLRTLHGRYRKTYLARWLREALVRPSVSRARSMKDVRRVTFVCRANRIRSPLAEVLLCAELERVAKIGYTIRSAGTLTRPEMTFDARAEAAARSMGHAFTGRPQVLTRALVDDSDLLVVMDRIVEAELLTQFPEAAAKVCHPNGRQIRDPDQYSQRDFSRFVEGLSAAVAQMARRLTQE